MQEGVEIKFICNIQILLNKWDLKCDLDLFVWDFQSYLKFFLKCTSSQSFTFSKNPICNVFSTLQTNNCCWLNTKLYFENKIKHNLNWESNPPFQ
jgi:hypothetical protein